ncbi:transglutaminase-like cysteine peptidase [Phenylobacterium sp.]|uniref:transglutaminase-like cysteine peptidase n=1 Tax=Phenylobacterium sp. TaxID=1871053 RepID=UPI00286ABB36|nr:transglutaminase-like cysteine peptidase [Phenylobacterium sp.]
MLNSQTIVRIGPIAAALVLACQAGVAQAAPDERSATAPIMRLSAHAAPPVAFLDLCERSLAACAIPGAAVPDMVTLRAAAMERFWADTFARRASAPAAGAADAVYDWSQIFAASRRRATSSPVFSLARPERGRPDDVVPSAVALVAASAPKTVSSEVEAMAAGDAVAPAIETGGGALTAGWTEAAGEVADAGAEVLVTVEGDSSLLVAPDVFPLDRRGWTVVNAVNRRINRSVRQLADVRQYGVEDYWSVPDGSRARGDCEDYVLAKRQALIAEGVPAEALSIAIVETRWGETHAVLLLASDQGEYVLDSLTPWVSRWDRVNYAWRERQVPGQPFDWVAIAL